MNFQIDKLLYGGDYNPEQWLNRPEILEKDLEMLKEAGCNTVTLGVFSWSVLEPREGCFVFGWLQEMIDRLYQQGISTILATPSGARPKWLSDHYPEVLRVDAYRRRQLFGGRHNHCYTSPVYREKVRIINRKLAREVAGHPGVILWHISNEYGGECHCPLCQQAFRNWLRERYGTIENLNERWCTTFWSHSYQSFDQIESPSPVGEFALHGLNLDWKRFVTEQTADFIRAEVAALREGGSNLPVTTNLMYYFEGLDYVRIARELDIVSWDTYPTWHKTDVWTTALDNGMCHDLMRSLKGKPFLQMESCPSSTNWQSVSKLKKPGVLFAQNMQAIAHGGDGTMYFQIRQSRGASEKFHGALIDHYGGNDTRVFREAFETGAVLATLRELAGSMVKSQAAILCDWNSIWAMKDSQGPRNQDLHYHETLLKYYRGFRRKGLNVDLIDQTADLSGYQVLALPMVYMFKEGFSQKVRAFVEQGGVLVVSYWSGVADGTDRCYLGESPHDLTDVLGIRREEIDGLYDWEENAMIPVPGNVLGLTEAYSCRYLCELAKVCGAEVLMTYGKDFYAGHPCLTVNPYGKGKAWYVAADGAQKFYDDFLSGMLAFCGIDGPAEEEIPEGLEITTRETEEAVYFLYQNFGTEPLRLPLPPGELSWICGNGQELLPVYGLAVAKQHR